MTLRFASVVIASLATVACLPSPPSDAELESQLASRRAEFETLVEAARSHGVNRMGVDFCEPPLEPAIERDLHEKMKELGVQTLTADDERGIVMLTTYTWGLAVSGVYRGYYFCPDGEFYVPAPKGERVALSRKRRVVRVDDHWLIYQGG